MAPSCPWTIVAGDFFPSGGMDIANFSLAQRWAQNERLHLISHRVDSTLLEHPNISTTIVRRPLNSHLLGEFKLRSEAAQVRRRKNHRIISNGGNVPCADVVWIHIVHGAYQVHPFGSILRRWKDRIHHHLAIKNEKKVLQSAQLVLCNSQKSSREVQQLYGIPQNRIEIVYLGANSELFSIVSPAQQELARKEMQLDNRKWCLFVGQLGNHMKGFDTIYDAWRHLTSQGYGFGLLVVGSGATMEYWQRRTKEDNLEGYIKFLGYRNDMNRIIAASELFIHPSRYDAYGLAVHEAICRGVPAIVSSSTGISELFSNDLSNYILQDSGSSQELRDKVIYWAKLEPHTVRQEFDDLTKKLRSRTWDGMADDFISAIRSRFN